MSNKSLAYRLGLYISMAVLLIFIVFMFLLLRFHIANRKESNEYKAKIRSSEIYMKVSDIVEKTEVTCSEISRQIQFYHENGMTQLFLAGILKEYNFLKSVEVKLDKTSTVLKDSFFVAVFKDNKIIYYQGNDPGDLCINEDTRRNYLPDMNDSAWSEPIVCKKMGINICVYTYPFEVKDSSGYIQTSGSIKCILSLDYFQNMFNETKILEKGYAFLTSPGGLCMTYPRQELIMKRNIQKAYYKENKRNNPDMEKFMKGESEPLIVYPPALNYKKGWSFSADIPESNWLIVFTVPFSELYQNIYSLMLQMSAVIAILVIAIFFLVFSIVNKVMKPLTKISKELHSFSIEILDHHQETQNETVALQKSLIMLQNRYEKYKQSEAEATKKGSKILSDLALASEIQQSIIPQAGNYTLQNSGITIHSVFRPAQIISGDLYDFFMLDEKRLLITMGDVSGGGIPAALFMGVAHTYIRSNSSYNTAKEIVSQINKQLCKNNSNQFFLTLFMGILDIQKGVLNFCNAGHSPTLLLSGSGNVRELNDQHGLPLGLYPQRDYKDSTVSIHKGDSLILYTDGITEHINESGEFFGVDGFYKVFNQIKNNSPEEIARLIMHDVDKFGENISQSDDLSLMVLSYN